MTERPTAVSDAEISRRLYERYPFLARQQNVSGVACGICGGPVYRQLCMSHDETRWLACRYCGERSNPTPCPECDAV